MNGLHSYNLRRRFERLNPGIGADVIDFNAATGSREDYGENLESLKSMYPQYVWEDREDFNAYGRDFIKSEALKLGLSVTVRADAAPRREADPNEFYDEVCESLMKTLLIITGERGSGKSTLAKNIVKRISDVSVKVFDSSCSWMHKAPLPYRQVVTWDKVRKNEITNVDNCIYELGALTKDQKKIFVSTIIKTDYSLRYAGALKYGSANPFKPILYVFEEAESFVGSYELRGNDRATETIRDFVTVGRNFLLSGIFICSAEASELSPTVRRRSRRIYGKTSAYTDLGEARRINKRLAETIRTQPRYSFTYYTDRIISAKIKDQVDTEPTDYVKPTPKQTIKTDTPMIKIHLTPPIQTPKPNPSNAGWWTQFLFALGIFGLLITYLIQL